MSESYKISKVTGHIKDYAIYKDGTRELINESYNLIVNNFGVLIASLMKQDSTYKDNTMYWAVGTGTTEASVLDTGLETEVYRKAIIAGDMSYMSGGSPSVSPTNQLRIIVTFGELEANYDLTEFGIFGGNASATVDSGVMINHKVHTTISKTSSFQLERTITFTF